MSALEDMDGVDRLDSAVTIGLKPPFVDTWFPNNLEDSDIADTMATQDSDPVCPTLL